MPRLFPPIYPTPSNFITSRNFLRSGSTHFHAISRGKLFVIASHRLASCDTTRDTPRTPGSIYSNDYTYLSLISRGGREGGRHRKPPRYGAERIVHGRIHRCTCDSRTWFHLARRPVDPPRQVPGARPRATKMRGGMIYNGVMGSRDDTAVIVAPLGIIAMPDLGLPSSGSDLGAIGASSRKLDLDCAMEK